MIPAIHEGHLHWSALEPPRGVQAAESPTHDEYVGRSGRPALTAHLSPLTVYNPIVCRRHRANRTTSSTGGTASSSLYAVNIRQRRYVLSGNGRNGDLAHQRRRRNAQTVRSRSSPSLGLTMPRQASRPVSDNQEPDMGQL